MSFHISHIYSYIASLYEKFFSISEFATDRKLQYIYACILLAYIFDFSGQLRGGFLDATAYQSGIYNCWPYWLECGQYYVLYNLPYGYSKSILYIGILTVIFSGLFSLSRGLYTRAHFIFLVLFIYKFIITYVFNANAGNYNYYDIVFSIVFLFFPYKFLFLQIAFINLYFISAPIKFDEGWILAQYFTSLKIGAPIWSNDIIPLVTMFVIFMQIIVTWYLVSSRYAYQRVAFILFGIFHIYSGFLVEYRYLLSTIPIGYFLFSQVPTTPLVLPRSYRALPGIVFMILLIFSQIWVSFGFSADRKLTLEWNFYSMYMFEANHQCSWKWTIYNKDGTNKSEERGNTNARFRCDPYNKWFDIQQLCKKDKNIDHIDWVYDHSVNGWPFYRIVDTVDACSLAYYPFSHNTWIRDQRLPQYIVGYPSKNKFF